MFKMPSFLLAGENQSCFISEKTKAQRVVALEAYGRGGGCTRVPGLPVLGSLESSFASERSFSAIAVKYFSQHPHPSLFLLCLPLGMGSTLYVCFAF